MEQMEETMKEEVGPNAESGTTNSGGGGGGSGTSSSCFGGTYAGKPGGSGIVIIRYKFQ